MLPAAISIAVLAGICSAQVLSPPEIQDLKMRELQQKHMRDLKGVAQTISSHSFPYRLYFSRTLDLSEQQQQRADQRSIRFDKFRTQTVLQITANYFASYSAVLMQKEERAQRTMQDVMVPMLQAAIPALIAEDKLQAFAIEISHHVRRKMLGVDTEYAENVAFILPRATAQRFISAESPSERQIVLKQGMLFIDGNPVEGWGRGDAEMVAESAEPTPPRSDSKPVAAKAWSPRMPALPIETDRSAGASTPPARLAAEPRPEVSEDNLRKLQSSNQEAVDRLVRELGKEAHFVAYAPPTFIAFHKGAYLQLSLTTTLQESTPGSQYRMAALAFDQHIAHLIRPVLASLKSRSDFDGMDFSTSVRLAGSAGDSAQAVEFIFPTAALACYEQYDCTGQQLINQGFVLINGERVGLELQSAEAGVAGPH
jgi:hypothetical protein